MVNTTGDVDRRRAGSVKVGRLRVERLRVYTRKVERPCIVRCGDKGRWSEVFSEVFIGVSEVRSC